MVILLFAVLGVALQLNRQLSDQQQIALNRITHIAVRNSAQLQREHLRLQAMLMDNAAVLDPEAFTLQRDLVWSRLRILQNPLHSNNTGQTVKALFHTYEVQWEALQPLLDHWVAAKPDERTQLDLLSKMTAAEQVLNDMLTASQHAFEVMKLVSACAMSRRESCRAAAPQCR